MPPSFNKQEPIKVFDKDNLNIADLAVCEMKMDMTQRVLVELYHMLEDGKLNAAQAVKVAGFIRDWRKRRRYYKCLWSVSKDLGPTQGKLIGAMQREHNKLEDSVRKTKDSVDHLNKVMQSEKEQRARETENVLDEIKNKLKGD